MSALVAFDGGAAVVSGKRLVCFDARGGVASELSLPRAASGLARFAGEWLVAAGDKRLLRVADDGEVCSFAEGRARVDAFAVGRDDSVAVARGAAVELWTRDDERKWAAKGGPYLALAVARDHVVALEAEGALVFLGKDRGDAQGALRLASPEAPTTWRLAWIDGATVVLALGEWLVWIDAQSRKTVRRVRARAKIAELAADADHVVVAVEEGVIQAFRASSGEPRAGFAPHEEGVRALALGREVLFTAGEEPFVVRPCDRQALDVTSKTAAPVAALAARGDLVGVADRTGAVRVVRAGRDIGSLATGEAPVGLCLTKNESVLVAGPRVVFAAARPWDAARPMALRAPPTVIAADDAYLFAGTLTGSVDVYDLAAARHVTSYALSSDDRITALVRLPGPLLVVGTGALDGRVLVVDVAAARVLHRMTPHDEAFGVTSLSADARGRIVASGGDDGSIVLLDPAKGRVLARLRVPETPVSIAFAPSGRSLACVFADGTAQIVSFADKGAKLTDLGLRGATKVAWADFPVFGFKDGHVESLDAPTGAAGRAAAP